MRRKSSTTWGIGIDIGGTFTDIVAINRSTGERVDGKVLTTQDDPLVGIWNALALIEERDGIPVSSCNSLVHATTLASNTLIERSGANVGLLTTSGFRDVIEIGREDRYDLYDLQIEIQSPLVTRDKRIGILERINSRGEVLTPVEVEQVDDSVARLGMVDSVAICFLHSYSNSSNERAVASMVAERLPESHISLSSDVSPIMREFERASVTVVNAYVAPRVSRYLGSLAKRLIDEDFGGTIGIMKSDGGMCSLDEASRHPVRILESGPVAGIVSAAYTAAQCGEELAVAFDMGGTTAKACLILQGQPSFTEELEVARLRRFTKGSGLPLRIPSFDLIEIGAGGGSIGWIDELGIMQVGPRSAGADPGPACYGRGGLFPTVTDADLLLGYLDPDNFAAGSIRLDKHMALDAVRTHILDKVESNDVTAASWGINDIVNENMARAARVHCLEHGIDPRTVSLVATGGAGPVHAAWLLSKLGARRVICPPSAGVAAALGLLLAPRTADQSVTDIVYLDELNDQSLHNRLRTLADEVHAQDVGSTYTESFWVHMRVEGQGYDIRIPTTLQSSLAELNTRFEEEYERRFGRAPWSGRRQVVRWAAQLSESQQSDVRVGASLEKRTTGGSRTAYFGPTHAWMETKVMDRAMLQSEGQVLGPLLLPEEGTTVLVLPDQIASCDMDNNVYIEASQATG